MASCDWISDRFAAPLFVPKLEEPAIAATCRVDGAFARRELHFPDIGVIPTPGHTEGSTCFLWDDGQRRYLFTGDTIYLKEGEWVVAVLSVSDRATYLKSLALIGELDFDDIVPSRLCREFWLKLKEGNERGSASGGELHKWVKLACGGPLDEKARARACGKPFRCCARRDQ